ncbi:MAG: C2H2-type zinc finger protein [Candidatus Nanohaloarchaea archaeon]
MAEKNPECPECGKSFTSQKYLKKHIDAEHGGEALEVPDENGIGMEFPDGEFALGVMTGVVVAVLLLGVYSVGGDYLRSQPFEVTVVTCDSCNYSDFRKTTNELFNVKYRQVDYRSEKGQRLIEKYNLYYVPGFIFDKEVRNRENFTMVKSVLVEFEDAYVLPDKGNRAAQRMSRGKSLQPQG